MATLPPTGASNGVMLFQFSYNKCVRLYSQVNQINVFRDWVLLLTQNDEININLYYVLNYEMLFLLTHILLCNLSYYKF